MLRTHASNKRGLPLPGAGARALFCILARLTSATRQSETDAVIACKRALSRRGQSRRFLRAGAVPGDILRRVGTAPLAEIIAAAGCSKASASDYRRGTRTQQVAT
jgi:hypothetical protein